MLIHWSTDGYRLNNGVVHRSKNYCQNLKHFDNVFFSQQTDPDISIKGGGGVNKKKSDFNAICFTKNQRIPRRNSKRKLQSMISKNLPSSGTNAPTRVSIRNCICNSSFLQNIVSFNVGDFDHCSIFVNILSRFSEKQLLHVPESLFSYDFIIFSKSSHNAS
jgi:hypothetical protein